MLLRSISDSTELALKTGSKIFQAIELSNGNISPMRDLDDSLYIGEINLWIVVDSVNDVILNSERFSIFPLVNNCVNTLGLSILIVFTEIKTKFT